MAEGYHDFTAGEILTAANLEDYCMLQSAMRFADASARNTALSGVLTEGLIAILEDTDLVTIYNGSAWVTLGYYGSATTWSPSLLQSGAPTYTNTSSTYQRQGKWVFGRFRLTVSATSMASGANNVTVSTPVTGATGYAIGDPVGQAWIYDSSVPTTFRAQLVMLTTTTFGFHTLHSTTGGYLGATDFTAALAANDLVVGSFAFEAASAS